MYLKNSLIVLVFLALVLMACNKKQMTSVPYFNGPEFTPLWPSEGDDTTGLHKIGDFEFVNQNNKLVSQDEFEGKVYVVNFIFTSCGSICPKMTNHMKMVQEELNQEKDRLMFLSHSVMPWEDDPQKLKAYAKKLDVDESNWHFVTGDKSKIYELARRDYFIEEEPGFTKDSTEFLHTEHFALIDNESHIRGIYNGTLELEMEKLIEDVRYVLNQE
jgi:protein SCO1